MKLAYALYFGAVVLTGAIAGMIQADHPHAALGLGVVLGMYTASAATVLYGSGRRVRP